MHRLARRCSYTASRGTWTCRFVVPIGRSARGRYLVHKTAKRVLINNFKERLFGALQLQRTTLNHIRTKCFEWIQAGSPGAGRCGCTLHGVRLLRGMAYAVLLLPLSALWALSLYVACSTGASAAQSCHSCEHSGVY